MDKKQEKYYLTYSTDNAKRYRASSGGFVRELLEYLLENKLVDGALVIKQENLRFFSYIARKVEDLEKMERSVYAPVDFEAGFKDFLPGEKYVIVGIPCQFHHLPENIKAQVFLKIGLFCGGTPEWAGTEFFCRSYGIKKPVEVHYRGQGCPGKLTIKTAEREYNFSRRLSLKKPYLRCVSLVAFKYPFFQSKCLQCRDTVNQLADISAGDAWLAERAGDELGGNAIIVRNNLGEELVKDLEKAGRIFSKELDADLVKEMLRSKRKILWPRLKRKLAKGKLAWLLIVWQFIEEYVIYWSWKGIFKKIFKK